MHFCVPLLCSPKLPVTRGFLCGQHGLAEVNPCWSPVIVTSHTTP